MYLFAPFGWLIRLMSIRSEFHPIVSSCPFGFIANPLLVAKLLFGPLRAGLIATAAIRRA